MTSKKTVSLVLAALLAATAVFTFTACGGKELTGIEITTEPTKVTYVKDEKFSPDGMVVSKVYSDKTKTALTENETYTWDLTGNLKLTDKKVTVSYTENEKTYKASVNIKVTNNVASVTVVSQPTKKDYIAGQTFDPAGMTIKGVYQNGEQGEVVNVTEDAVTYKTGGLVKSDEHFKMNYSGCEFYIDLTVLHGAFLEAEKGQVDGAEIASAAPSKEAIDKDYANAYGNRDDNQGHRGIDEGKNCKDILGTGNPDYSCEKGGANGCTIDGGRVGIRNYVYSHLEWTETTGGEPAKSGMMQKNHVNFGGAGQKMLYKLTADKAGKVLLTFKMANPNIVRHEANDPDGYADGTYTATETKLSEVFKISVGTSEVTIPDTVKLSAVDWSEYKAYNADADFAVKGQQDKYTGKYCIPTFYWQEVTVEITVAEGVNSLTVESLWAKDVKLDSISCNADEDEITISLNSEFKPTVTSAKLKVDGAKVLLGVIADAHAVGFTDDEIKGYFMNTKAASVGCATYKGNTIGGVGENDHNIVKGDEYNDPWTQATDRGGLGYDAPPYAVDLSSNNNSTKVSYKDKMGGKGNADSVEKITEGDYAGCFIIWFDVTIPAEDSDNFVGVWTFSNFHYGTDFAASKPSQDILKTDEDVTAELGGYCYQAYCDARDENVSFGWSNLCLVVQKGSFEGANACHKLMRRYVSHLTDNDQELVDMRNPQA